MREEPVVTAALIIIGNEILSGRTQDANLAYIATALNEVGVRLTEARVIADVEEIIVETVNTLRGKYDYVFTTGGIGPTHDDITAESVAKAFGRKLIRHPEAYHRMVERYEQTGMELNKARLRMANTPEGADLIDNDISVAPGFKVENVYVMAGVPQIAQVMIDSAKETLKGAMPVRSRTLTCSIGEGVVAEGLGVIQGRYPDVDLGSYPYYRKGLGGTSLVMRGTDEVVLDKVADEVAELVRSFGVEPALEN